MVYYSQNLWWSSRSCVWTFHFPLAVWCCPSANVCAKKCRCYCSKKWRAVTRCIGFLDGTIRQQCRPVRGQRAIFSGHKRYHGLKFQALTVPDGLIAAMFGPVEGRLHDSTMLEFSWSLLSCLVSTSTGMVHTHSVQNFWNRRLDQTLHLHRQLGTQQCQVCAYWWSGVFVLYQKYGVMSASPLASKFWNPNQPNLILLQLS